LVTTGSVVDYVLPCFSKVNVLCRSCHTVTFCGPVKSAELKSKCKSLVLYSVIDKGDWQSSMLIISQIFIVSLAQVI